MATRRLAKPRPVQGEAGSDDAARRGTGYAARAVAQAPAKRDGHPRQNPAYGPAKETALATGLFLWTRFRRRLVRLAIAFTYHGRTMLLALQLCFESKGSLVQAVDLRRDQSRPLDLEYEPSLSTIRFPRERIDRLLQLAASATG